MWALVGSAKVIWEVAVLFWIMWALVGGAGVVMDLLIGFCGDLLEMHYIYLIVSCLDVFNLVITLEFDMFPLC